jgi:hypothetical protein
MMEDRRYRDQRGRFTRGSITPLDNQGRRTVDQRIRRAYRTGRNQSKRGQEGRERKYQSLVIQRRLTVWIPEYLALKATSGSWVFCSCCCQGNRHRYHMESCQRLSTLSLAIQLESHSRSRRSNASCNISPLPRHQPIYKQAWYQICQPSSSRIQQEYPRDHLPCR